MNDIEIWGKIKNYENLYEISNHGNRFIREYIIEE